MDELLLMARYLLVNRWKWWYIACLATCCVNLLLLFSQCFVGIECGPFDKLYTKIEWAQITRSYCLEMFSVCVLLIWISNVIQPSQFCLQAIWKRVSVLCSRNSGSWIIGIGSLFRLRKWSTLMTTSLISIDVSIIEGLLFVQWALFMYLLN